MRKTLWLCAAGLALVQASASAQTGFRNVVDHIHLGAPDQAAAVAWYRDNFAGEPTTEGPDRLMFGETRLLVARNEKPQPSVGSSVDHIAFSVTNLDATIKTLQGRGVKIVEPAHDMSGLFRAAVVEDPWGTRVEVVQDPQKLGLHHIHLRAADPSSALAWYVQTFGGRAGKLKNRIDGVEFGGVWILADMGAAPPSQGHSIDHIGFRPINVDAAIADLKTKSVKVTAEPRALTLPSGVEMRLAFVESPGGVRIELVQR